MSAMADADSRVREVFDIVRADNYETARFVLNEALWRVDLSVCPNCGEFRPGDAVIIIMNGRCWTCGDLADEARYG